MEHYKNIGKPTYKFIAAADIPSYTNYKNMLYNAKKDMITILNGYQNINSEIESFKNNVGSNIEMILKKISSLYMMIEDTEKSIDELKSISNIVYCDDFSEDKNTHIENSTENTASVDISSRSLSLPFLENISVSKSLNVRILEGSNGFPGNTHEVYDLINNNITFTSENDPHINLGDIKKDADRTFNNSKWFEFEMYKLDQEVLEKTSGIGFKFKEGISWINQDDDSLKLILEAYSDSPIETNHIELRLLPKQNAFSTNPILKKVTISNEEAKKQILYINKEVKDKIFIPFQLQTVTSVIFELEQPESIRTKVCREYALKIDSTTTSKFEDDFDNYIHVESPKVSIELLGLKYNNKDKSIIFSDTKNTTDFIDNEFIKSNLFSPRSFNNDLKNVNEIVDANRYYIAIKELDFKKRKYKTDGIYISNTFKSKNDIKQVIFNSEDFIPIEFEEYLKDGENINDFIEYYIMFDTDYVWYRIYPRHRSFLGPCAIHINSNSIIKNRSNKILYLDSLKEAREFTIKIVFKRPEELQNMTPIVYGYNVEVNHKESVI